MKILQHLSALVIITLIMGLIYACVQQVYRSGANDPQSQIIYDLKEQLQQGKSLSTLFLDSFDLVKSQSVFTEIYDDAGNAMKSSAYLQGRLPQLPKGVIEHARADGENWVTWEPQSHVRLAMGIVRVNTSPVSFVAVGRSLYKAEERISRLNAMVIIAWLLCCSVVLINWLGHYLQVRKQQTHI